MEAQTFIEEATKRYQLLKRLGKVQLLKDNSKCIAVQTINLSPAVVIQAASVAIIMLKN